MAYRQLNGIERQQSIHLFTLLNRLVEQNGQLLDPVVAINVDNNIVRLHSRQFLSYIRFQLVDLPLRIPVELLQ